MILMGARARPLLRSNKRLCYHHCTHYARGAVMKQSAAAFIICFCEAGSARQARNPREQTAGSVSTPWRICCCALEQKSLRDTL